MRFPSPETVAAFKWTDQDRALVEDRVATQFVGSPETVAKHLRVLQEVTGADELLVTAITLPPRRPGAVLRTARPRVGPDVTAEPLLPARGTVILIREAIGC